jgi:pyruvate/2-oxoglutarate dehydrogenase complex dihydrolipoamide acyltransferase (E2) component
MEVKYSYDERIADGLYAAITLLGVKERLENPNSLD